MDIPEPLNRPELALWMWRRGLKPIDLEIPLRCSWQTIRRCCLPFDHPGRRKPTDAFLEATLELTSGEITPIHFLPPHLRRAAADSASGDPEGLRLARAH